MRRRKWQPTPVLLPGESHRQRSVVGYNPWDGKELDMTEQLHSLRTKFKIKLIKKKRIFWGHGWTAQIFYIHFCKSKKFGSNLTHMVLPSSNSTFFSLLIPILFIKECVWEKASYILHYIRKNFYWTEFFT